MRVSNKCELRVFFSTQLLRSQSVLILYTRMHKPYTNATIKNAMQVEHSSQLKLVLPYVQMPTFVHGGADVTHSKTLPCWHLATYQCPGIRPG